MRILQNTPDRLVIRDRPFLTAALVWLAAGALIWAGAVGGLSEHTDTRIAAISTGVLFGLLAWRMLPTITVTFDRPRNAVVRRFGRLTGISEREFRLTDVHSAGIARSLFRTGGLRRIALNPKSRFISLEYGLVALRRRALAGEINRWLAGV